MFGTSDLVDLIIEGYEKLAAEDRRGWSTAALGDRITAVASARVRLDAELDTGDPGKGHERLGLHVSPTPLGSVLGGFLDPEGARTGRAATPPPRAADRPLVT